MPLFLPCEPNPDVNHYARAGPKSGTGELPALANDDLNHQVVAGHTQL